MRQSNITLEEAVALACKYHDDTKFKFIRLLNELPSYGNQVDKELYEYIFNLANWPRANASWNFESRRYFGEQRFEAQRTRQVEMLPQVKQDT